MYTVQVIRNGSQNGNGAQLKFLISNFSLTCALILDAMKYCNFTW